MFGGNPNTSTNPFKPLSGQYLAQQSGGHNQNGAAGFQGANAIQPLAGRALNSAPSYVPRFQHASHPTPNPAFVGTKGEPISFMPERYTPPYDPQGVTRYGKAMQGYRGDQIRHHEAVVRNMRQQLDSSKAAARQMRLLQGQQELLSERDLRTAQLSMPRSGTHVFRF